MIVYSDYGNSRWRVYWETPDGFTETYENASLTVIGVATPCVSSFLCASSLRKDMKGILRKVAERVGIAPDSDDILELSSYIHKFLRDVDEKYHKVLKDNKLFENTIDGLKRGIHILEMRGSTRLADDLKKSKEVFELLSEEWLD